MPYVKTLVFLLLVPGTVVGWVPWAILRAVGAAPQPAFGLLQLVGLGLGAAGAASALSAMFDFAHVGRGTPAPIDPPTTLVVRGVYRWTRNPMYVGIGMLLLAQALYFEAPLLALYAACVLAAFHLFVVCYEEPTLRRTFGAAYEVYCAAVPRWVGRRRA